MEPDNPKDAVVCVKVNKNCWAFKERCPGKICENIYFSFCGVIHTNTHLCKSLTLEMERVCKSLAEWACLDRQNLWKFWSRNQPKWNKFKNFVNQDFLLSLFPIESSSYPKKFPEEGQKRVRLNECSSYRKVRVNRKFLQGNITKISRDPRKKFEVIKVQVNRCSSYRKLTLNGSCCSKHQSTGKNLTQSFRWLLLGEGIILN